ncbi:Hint domain-containing protein [Ancylobacter sp. Lp-2]|uniref:Hint domain-containing protein n=1 Tax=Ancylobacter sp. Lp-2 TaxID=2881339 RepID=UPI001E4C4DE8|nr:Hint domain-containing protein [Ancylobacter sp. Lp-2]MCB4766989.1 Hint domain-containing protein [Ancylobacter sp. Lp-2]
MDLKIFRYAYAVTADGYVIGGSDPGQADNPFVDVLIGTVDDPELDPDNPVFAYVAPDGGSGNAYFYYASGDGLVAGLGSGVYWWFTDTEQEADAYAERDGDSFIVCFLAGTMIATPTGEVAIETLEAGDLVLTADGSAKPVRWLARQTVSTLFADPLKVMPVRIAAGALGDGVPLRDLSVSSDHALEIDGVLVQAGALVNTASIARRTDMPEIFVYYHVELDEHALILAEGVPAETFVDNVTRRRFDNWQEAPEAPILELDLPRVKSARQLPRHIHERLAARAELLGLATRDDRVA